MKIKLRKIDTLFSLYIRERDNWTCQRCYAKYEERSQGLQNSHYWGRGRENTRFEPDNCIALCFGCHRLWGHGDLRDQYKKFMIRKLGQQRFDTLEVQANTYKKRDDKMDEIIIKQLLKEQECLQ